MLFSSPIFLFVFLPIVLLVYFLVPRRERNLVLFVASLFFYAWGEPVYVLLMLFSTFVNYGFGLLMTRLRERGEFSRAKAALVAITVINVGLLVFFKYTDFFLSALGLIPGVTAPQLGIALPIGISFYTFHSISYTVDVYRGITRAERSVVTFGAYVFLFPQLIAGPIIQYKTVREQLHGRRESFERFASGVGRFVVGFAKKALLANNIGVVWHNIQQQDPSSLPVATAWIGILAFTFQIYFDFSGYSDMAIGLARMFGFEFPENFNYPYLSRSLTEFWRRWHISLGNFFREYVYIPLGGNRRGLLKQARNILIVWMLTGFWHGAAVNFIVWGLYFAVFLLLEKMFLLRLLEKLPRAVSHIYALLFIVFGWVIFSFDDFSRGFTFLRAMLGLTGAGLSNNASVYLLYTNALLLVVLAVGSPQLPARAAKAFERRLQNRQVLLAVVQNAVYLLLLTGSLACVVSSSYNPFLYFRF